MLLYHQRTESFGSTIVVSSSGVQPELAFIPPDPDPRVIGLTRLLLPFWTRWRERLVEVEASHVERLVQLYEGFQTENWRFLIAFRHPSPEDSFCLANLIWQQVPARAKALNSPLKLPVHAHFIYDRGIPLWAGAGVGWLYAKLGGTPIQRGKMDRQGLRSARDLFAHGRWPIAAAPEGGNNGHTAIISPLEPGVAQMGFWCMEDRLKLDADPKVFILPLGIAYRYVTPPWEQLDQLLGDLESQVGLSTVAVPATDAMEQRYQRLLQLGEHLLGVVEGYYQQVYPQVQPVVEPDPQATDLGHRLAALMDRALQVAETYFHLSPKGSVIDRCRRIEQAGWDRIFRQGEVTSPVDQGLADRIAEEAQLRMWHMRLVEHFVAVTGQYVRQHPTAERFAETLLILRDTITLIQGKNPFPRPKLGDQIASLTVGEPIAIHDRWSDYRQGRKQAVAQLTSDLQASLEGLIAGAE